MDKTKLDELTKGAQEYYDANKDDQTKIEAEQKKLIELVKKFEVNIIDINRKIDGQKGITLGDLDVVLEHNGTIIIIECKNRSGSRIKNAENFFGFYKNEMDEIKKLYAGKTNEYKFVYCDALTEANDKIAKDLIKFQEKNADNIVFLSNDLEYFYNIVQVEQYLARNEFFSNLKLKYDSITKDIPAAKNIVNGINVYVLFLNPVDIFECVTIVRKRHSNSYILGFQRGIIQEKLTQISEYILKSMEKKGYGIAFPNAIILSSGDELDFTEKDLGQFRNLVGTTVGLLKFPLDYGRISLIDGQHRLLGYSKIKSKLTGDERLPVIILENLKYENMAKLFLDINSTPTNVDPSLRLLISADIDWPEDQIAKNLEKSIVNDVLRFMRDEEFGEEEIFLGHFTTERGKKLTLTTLVRAVRVNRLYKVSLNKSDYPITKSILLNMYDSSAKSFYLSNIGFRVTCRILGICKKEKKKITKAAIKKLIKKIATLDLATYETEYGEGGARKAADKLVYVLCEKYPELKTTYKKFQKICEEQKVKQPK